MQLNMPLQHVSLMGAIVQGAASGCDAAESMAPTNLSAPNSGHQPGADKL